jgi:hypothetical protein
MFGLGINLYFVGICPSNHIDSHFRLLCMHNDMNEGLLVTTYVAVINTPTHLGKPGAFDIMQCFRRGHLTL